MICIHCGVEVVMITHGKAMIWVHSHSMRLRCDESDDRAAVAGGLSPVVG